MLNTPDFRNPKSPTMPSIRNSSINKRVYREINESSFSDRLDLSLIQTALLRNY